MVPDRSDGRRDFDHSWNEAEAAKLVGSVALVGVTFVDAGGKCRQMQVFGTVSAAESGRGIDIALDGSRAGDTYTLPPDLTAFRPASPGHYRLRETGETVVDPDLLVTYEVHMADEG